MCLPKFMFGQKHILNRQKTASILSQGVEVDLNSERSDSKIQVFQIRLTFPIWLELGENQGRIMANSISQNWKLKNIKEKPWLVISDKKLGSKSSNSQRSKSCRLFFMSLASNEYFFAKEVAELSYIELSLILWLCKRLPKILRGYHIIY